MSVSDGGTPSGWRLHDLKSSRLTFPDLTRLQPAERGASPNHGSATLGSSQIPLTLCMSTAAARLCHDVAQA